MKREIIRRKLTPDEFDELCRLERNHEYWPYEFKAALTGGGYSCHIQISACADGLPDLVVTPDPEFSCIRRQPTGADISATL